MSMSAALAAKLAKAKKVGPNMTEAQKGGDYTPPAEGVARLRLIGYYELGTHVEQTGKFIGKKNRKVQLVFELSGRNHAPAEVEGKKIPIRMSLELNYSLNEKAAFFKLFTVMNAAHGGQATIMAELLGKEFLGKVVHVKKGDKVYANLERDSIKKAVRLDEDDNEVPIKVDEPISELKFFIWDIADMEMWDAIFIDGHYEERKNEAGEVTHAARSKNVLQEKILSAVDVQSLPIYDLIKGKHTAADEASMDEALGAGDNDDDRPPFATCDVDLEDIV